MKILHSLRRSFATTPPGTRIAAIVLVGCVVIFVGQSIAVVQYRWYTCAECRLYEKRARCLKWAWKDVQDNACHQWYASNVAGPHEHLWIAGVDTYGCDLLGYYGRDFPGYRSAGGNLDSRPIWVISPHEQLAIYHSAPNQKSAIRAFRAFYLAWSAGNHDAGKNLSGLIRCWRDKNSYRTVDWEEVMEAVAAIDGDNAAE